MAKRSERRIHESTRRVLTQLAFLVLGSGPLLFCCGWSLLQYLPFYHAWERSRWEQELGIATGFAVDILQVEPLSPSRTRLHEVRLRDPESKVAFAKIDLVDLDRSNQTHVIPRIVLEGPQLFEAWRHLHEDFICRPDRRYRGTRIRVDSVAIHGTGAPRELLRTAIEVLPADNATKVSLNFVPAVPAANASDGRLDREVEPIQIVLERKHEKGEQQTRVQVLAANTPLPCALIRLVQPAVAHLGEQAEMLGGVGFEFNQAGWRILPGIDEAGQKTGLLLKNLDFGRLSWNAPEVVSGTGWIRLDDLRIERGKINKLYGALSIARGEIRRECLQAFGQGLGIAMAEEMTHAPPGAEGFGAVSLLFYIDVPRQSLQIAGGLDPRGTAMRDRTGVPLAARDPFLWKQAIPLGNLVQAFDLSHGASGISERGPSRAVANTPTATSFKTPIASALSRWMMPSGDADAVTRTASEPEQQLSDTHH